MRTAIEQCCMERAHAPIAQIAVDVYTPLARKRASKPETAQSLHASFATARDKESDLKFAFRNTSWTRSGSPRDRTWPGRPRLGASGATHAPA